MGLMQCVAEAAYKAGGTTIGMVPTLVEQGGRVSDCLTETYHCHNLSDRKDLMARHSDVFVALPGGFGTLDEIFSIAASATIGYHKKKVVLYNINGFWTSLIALLDDLQAHGLMRAPWKDYIMVASSLDEIEQLLMVDC